MGDVVLVVPPAGDKTYYPDDDSDRLGVAYLAAAVKAQGYSVKVINCQRDRLGVAQAVQAVNDQDSALVGLSVLFSESELTGAVEIAAHVKAARPETCVVMGGHPVTFMADALVRHFACLDGVVRGEGEGILPPLTGRVVSGQAWRDLPGLTCRETESGRIVANPLPPAIADLDRLPFPLRHAEPAGTRTTCSMLSSRGCYATCSFCSVSDFTRLAPGRLWRGRTPKNVVDEIEWLHRERGVRNIIFVDDNFIGPGQMGRERAAAIARELIRRRLYVGFSLECRVDQVDSDLFGLLKRAGLGWVLVGIESGVQRTLDLFDKKTRVATNRQALETLRQLDLQIGVGFILFEPFTTPEDLKQNLRFIRQTGLADDVDFLQHFYNTLRLNPGSALTRKLAQMDLLETRYTHALGQFPVGYTFRFVDPRTAHLHRLAEKLRIELGERLWTQRLWEHNRQRYLAALPQEDSMRRHAGLESAWSCGSARAWILAQERLALQAFEALVDDALPRSCLDEAEVLDHTERTLAAMCTLDQQMLGKAFRDWFRHLEAGLSAGEPRERIAGAA